MYEVDRDPHEASRNVDALLTAIPEVDAWEAVQLADELTLIMIAIDAIPP